MEIVAKTVAFINVDANNRGFRIDVNLPLLLRSIQFKDSTTPPENYYVAAMSNKLHLSSSSLMDLSILTTNCKIASSSLPSAPIVKKKEDEKSST
ncbi:unnamed protein product [Caenorhabditis sp. 36 PRJEB53466]|nr:unnamed protein product [Caenorhabditis sp. 36 PRJEB53466]